MEAIVLAGGLGTRLSSRLRGIPKAMAPVAGRPFLAVLLDQLLAAGCVRAILSVGFLHQSIRTTFQDTYRGMPLEYVVEETPLGTGGAIRLALSQVHDPAALVLNGDTYLDANLSLMLSEHLSAGRTMTMAVVRVPDTSRYGGVLVENQRIVGFVEKGTEGSGWINAGAYVLNRLFHWPANLPSKFSFETDVLSPYIDEIKPAAFVCDGYFLDIGVPEDLDRAQVELARCRQ